MNLIFIQQINSIIAWLLLVLILLLSLPAFTSSMVKKFKLSKAHWLWVINKKLHKIHLELSAVCSICVIIHITLSYAVLKNFPLLGFVIILLFVVLALSGALKKKMSPKWFIIHKRTAILLLIAALWHIIYELP